MDLRNLNAVPAFVTKGGSEIRELLGAYEHADTVLTGSDPKL